MERPRIVKYTNPSYLEDYPCGAFTAGHLVQDNSGWRVFSPLIDHEKCIRCLRCFLVCPDGVIDKSKDMLEIDYRFCKGCGICSYECKVGAVKMVREGDEINAG